MNKVIRLIKKIIDYISQESAEYENRYEIREYKKNIAKLYKANNHFKL